MSKVEDVCQAWSVVREQLFNNAGGAVLPALQTSVLRTERRRFASESELRTALATKGPLIGWASMQSAHTLVHPHAPLSTAHGALLEGEFRANEVSLALQYLGPEGWELVEFHEDQGEPVLVECHSHHGTRAAPGKLDYRVYWSTEGARLRVIGAAFIGFRQDGAT